MDAATIAATLALVKQAIKVSGDLKHQDIREALVAAREALNDLREKNLELEDENRALKGALKKTQDVVHAKGAVWEKLEDGTYRGPCCPGKCWEVDHNLMPLSEIPVGSVLWTCPSCKAHYGHNVPRKFTK